MSNQIIELKLEFVICQADIEFQQVFEDMENILNLTRETLGKWFEKHNMRAFRAGQVFKWLYLRQADSFEVMTDLSKDLRCYLERHFFINRLEVADRQVSSDTTEKFLFRLDDGQHIESVLIPEKDHFTLCVSSQVGCAQNCAFCLTAKGGFRRNLATSEIVAQVRDTRNYLLNHKKIDPLKLSNIVFMGMGEPLANYQNVATAIDIITDTDFGLKFSSRRVTVSTCGLVPNIVQLGLDTSVNLAISLNATDNETRTSLMPVNRTYPIEKLLDACRQFSMKPRDKITFEYILIQGVNDTMADAKMLVKLLSPLKAKVNLIPFNGHDKSPFKRPDARQIQSFLQYLLDRNMTAIIRKSKGDDILAACGQLRARLDDTV